MLVKLQSVLSKAQRGGYAVGAFNVSDLEQAQAVIQAARQLQSPVIVNTSPKAIAYAGLEELVAVVSAMAKKTPVPIVLNLDHGRQVSLAKDCLSAGYTGIMFDGSRLPFETNVKQTRVVAQAGRKYGIGVEGELGRVKYPNELKKNSQLVLTDPELARDFVRSTGIVALAVAIGNSHGVPLPHERLDFSRLAEIRKRVSLPLVLHGASGTSSTHIRRAIKLGVCKINIDTDLRQAFTKSVRMTLRTRPDMFDPREYLATSRDAMGRVVAEKILQFGSQRKAR